MVGSVRKGGNKVRINAKLIDAEKDTQIWSQNWDRSLEDIFEIQDEVSQKVAVIISPALKANEIQQLEIKKNNARFEEFENTISVLKNKLDTTEKNSLKNKNFIDEQNIKLEELATKTKEANEKISSAEEKNNNKIVELEQKIQNTSKLMLSSSKSELSDRLYLAKSLVDRLKSGVPYAPQLVALGQEGLDPALLRFAKGGAPT